MTSIFLLNGHLDSGLEYYQVLSKYNRDIKLVLQLVGDRLEQSIFSVKVDDIPLGFTKSTGKTNLDIELTRLFDINTNNLYYIKYNSHSFRDFTNINISYIFSQ